MVRLDGDAPIPAEYRGGFVARGNFDGFHLGHQAVVGRAVELARAGGAPAIVATFDPHPARLFMPDAPPFRLTTLDQRARLFAAAGADAMLVFGFDARLAALSAEAFVAERLAGFLGAAGVVTGEDFTYGKGRAGTTASLAADGAAHGFTAHVVAPVSDAGGPVSSTRIRRALVAGDPREAARLLTRPFTVEGTVIHGDKLGRTIGYPTANLLLDRYLRPAYGIYAARGRLADGRVLAGAANVGIRPTFTPPKELLEVHFLDFAGDLYDRSIEVELIEYLRPEARFEDLDALTAQMARDCARAAEILRAA